MTDMETQPRIVPDFGDDDETDRKLVLEFLASLDEKR